MKNSILIIGANGGIGRQTVEKALAAGFRVTAIVRDFILHHITDESTYKGVVEIGY